MFDDDIWFLWDDFGSGLVMCSLERVGDVYILWFMGDLDEYCLNLVFCDEIIRNFVIVNELDVLVFLIINDGKYFFNGLDFVWVN